jgi:integrase
VKRGGVDALQGAARPGHPRRPLGCGLRRSEVAALTFKHIQQRDGRWCIVDLVGKHGRVRTVPMPTWVKVAIDAWAASAGIADGPVFRSLNRGRDIRRRPCARRWFGSSSGPTLRPPAWPESRLMIVAAHARSCAGPGGELEQIPMLPGHQSVQTTERYLGTRQDLVHAANGGIKLRAAV